MSRGILLKRRREFAQREYFSRGTLPTKKETVKRAHGSLLDSLFKGKPEESELDRGTRVT